MKLRYEIRGPGEGGEAGLDLMTGSSPGELAKTLVLGLTATLLLSVGLYIVISGLVIAFLALVL